MIFEEEFDVSKVLANGARFEAPHLTAFLRDLRHSGRVMMRFKIIQCCGGCVQLVAKKADGGAHERWTEAAKRKTF